eukprot:CAMPEP_0194314214 /NCGR_PEP_ID=MMETSP0171-20130528/11041_1 /TAXON_ID=218684 /ORGANISM="Corethron pennatum, Strain L29A3" /LENGTH=99 /DNA_ID=CAMNT_0039069511 /DNA_START=130 /DNA_END=427 /DNA_ORIENTATION=+
MVAAASISLNLVLRPHDTNAVDEEEGCRPFPPTPSRPAPSSEKEEEEAATIAVVASTAATDEGASAPFFTYILKLRSQESAEKVSQRASASETSPGTSP